VGVAAAHAGFFSAARPSSGRRRYRDALAARMVLDNKESKPCEEQ
jgi:hypothetical protein